MPHIHVEFSDSDIDRESEQPPSEIDDAHQRVPRIIAPRPACGACGGLHGKFLPVNSEPTIPKYRVKLYTENGVRSAEAFNFECAKCGARSGVVGYTKMGRQEELNIREVHYTDILHCFYYYAHSTISLGRSLYIFFPFHPP